MQIWDLIIFSHLSLAIVALQWTTSLNFIDSGQRGPLLPVEVSYGAGHGLLPLPSLGLLLGQWVQLWSPTRSSPLIHQPPYRRRAKAQPHQLHWPLVIAHVDICPGQSRRTGRENSKQERLWLRSRIPPFTQSLGLLKSSLCDLVSLRQMQGTLCVQKWTPDWPCRFLILMSSP